MEFYVWDSASEASFNQLLHFIFGSGYNNALISWKSFAQFCLCFLFLSSGFFAQWENPLRRDGESGWNVRVGLVVNLFYSHIFVCVSHLWFVIWDESEGHSGYVHRSLGWKGWAQLCTGESSGTILLVRFIGVAPCSHTVEQCATDGTHIILPHQSVEASC